MLNFIAQTGCEMRRVFMCLRTRTNCRLVGKQ